MHLLGPTHVSTGHTGKKKSSVSSLGDMHYFPASHKGSCGVFQSDCQTHSGLIHQITTRDIHQRRFQVHDLRGQEEKTLHSNFQSHSGLTDPTTIRGTYILKTYSSFMSSEDEKSGLARRRSALRLLCELLLVAVHHNTLPLVSTVRALAAADFERDPATAQAGPYISNLHALKHGWGLSWAAYVMVTGSQHPTCMT